MTLPDGKPLRLDMGPEFRFDGQVPERYYQNQPSTSMQDLISADIAQTLADEIIADFAAIREKMKTFLKAYTADQKSHFPKLGNGNFAFENVMREAADENPGKLAADFAMAKWDQDRTFSRIFSPVVAVSQKLTSDMEDTLMAADSDSYDAANDAYNDLKRDAVGPKIDEARAMKRERRRGNTPKPSTSPTP
jgi:hypothetical protein